MRKLCLLLAAIAAGMSLTGCLSQQDVDKLNGRFMSRDSRLVRATVDEMAAHDDERFVEMAAAYLENAEEVRATPPLPDPVEARVDGAIRLLVQCNPERARRMLERALAAEPSSSFRLPPWSLRLASAVNSPLVWERLCQLYRADVLRYYERHDIGTALLNAGNDRFLNDVRDLARERDDLSVGFLARSASADDIDLLLWCLENTEPRHAELIKAIGSTRTSQGLAALLKLADSENWRNWTEAEALATALAGYSDEQSAAVLHRLAAGGDRQVRVAAQRALVSRGDTVYFEAMYRRLAEAPGWAEADHIIREFSEDGTPACLDILRRHMRERSTDSWPLSALALAEKGDAEASTALSAALTNDPKSVEPLFRIPYFQRLITPAHFDLLLALASRDHSNRQVLLEQVRRSLEKNAPAELIEPLTAGLQHSDPLAREACVVWLHAAKRSAAAEALRPMLEDPSPGVRHRVIATMATTADADVKVTFRKILKESPDPVARRIVAGALGQWGDGDLASDLEDALTDTDAYVRANAMASLAQLDRGRADIAIMALLDDSSLHVRNEAIRCATNLKFADAVEKILPFLEHDNPRLRSSAVQFFKAVPDERSIPAIAAGLRGNSLAERQTALRALVDLKATSAAENVLDALAGEPDDLTGDLLRYFAVCPDARCVPRLLELLAEQEHSRWHGPVIQTLGCQKDDRAVDALGEALNRPGRSHDRASLRQRAAEALVQIATPQALAVLKQAEESGDAAVRSAVTRARRSMAR